MLKNNKHFADARCFFYTQKGVVCIEGKEAVLQ